MLAFSFPLVLQYSVHVQQYELERAETRRVYERAYALKYRRMGFGPHRDLLHCGLKYLHQLHLDHLGGWT